jgi:transposase
MTPEEELLELRQENKDLHERLAQRDELIAHLQQRVQALEERLAKDSHNSHLPPSLDRFVRQPKSLRKKSGKKAGGQQGHKGATLMWHACPDEVIVHAVTCCDHCQHDLQAVKPLQIERRQVVDVPAPRLLVQEHQAVRKQCPDCQQITAAAFTAGVDAPNPVRHA